MSQDGRIITVGAAASDLDIFIKTGQNGELIDPTDIRFRIFDPVGTEAITETLGTYISTGHYSASGAIIPTGYTLGDNWQIRWDVVLPGGASGQFIENFSVALPTLSATFADPNTDNNIESMFDRVRVDIGDPDAIIFTDGLLRRVLKKSISRVNRRLGLVRITNNSSYIYVIAFTSTVSPNPVLTIDLVEGTITPDTDPYVDIVILQMEEILLQSETVALQRLNLRTAGAFGSGLQGVDADGVAVTNADGVSISKAATRLTHRSDLAKFNLQNISAQLEQAIRDLRWRLSGGSGRDVTMPRWGGYYGPGYVGGNLI